MKQLRMYLKPYRLQFIIGPFFKLLEAVLELFMPIYMAKIIDNGIARGDTSYILKMGVVMLINASVGFGSAIICQYSASVASQGFGTAVRNALFRHVLKLSYSQIDRYGVQPLSNRITNDVTQLQQAVAMTIRLVIRAPFICIGSVIATLLIDPWIGLIVLAVLPLFSLVLFLIMRTASPLYTKVQQRLDALSVTLRESLSGVRVIRAFAREKHERDRFAARNDDLNDTTVSVGKISSLLNPITSLILNASILAIIWFGGFRVNTGHLTQGEVLAFISYVTQMLATLIVVANLVILFTRSAASLRRVNEIFAVAPDGVEDERESPTPAPAESDDAVVFDNVGFRYPAGGEQVLSHISFRLPRGASLGIIGATGSGKTSLVNLIPRFYAPDSGRIWVNGKEAGQYAAAELRGMIGIVPQKTELFSGTVAENLRWGNPDAGESLLREAARTAQAYEFISKLPGGLQSKVERGGVNLSGGQRQRLTIARALAKRPSILILDDSASALDYATDAALRAALKTDCAGMTVIIVSQRVWAVRGCDTILVLDDGHVAGSGTHASLMESCPEYREIVLSQENGDREHRPRPESADA